MTCCASLLQRCPTSHFDRYLSGHLISNNDRDEVRRSVLAGPVAADDRFGSYRASVHYLAGERVRQLTATSPRLWIAILLAVALAGCATRPAPDFGGRWKPVNRYSEAPNEIPLHQSYVFYPSPMDGTLKAMLTRWTQDSNMKLDYQHYSDFTLHQAVSQIHTTSLPDAISQLNSAYNNNKNE